MTATATISQSLRRLGAACRGAGAASDEGGSVLLEANILSSSPILLFDKKNLWSEHQTVLKIGNILSRTHQRLGAVNLQLFLLKTSYDFLASHTSQTFCSDYPFFLKFGDFFFAVLQDVSVDLFVAASKRRVQPLNLARRF